MTEAVEVAIELALIGRAKAFATAQSLSISLPNIKFVPPEINPNARYLRATFLPADTATIGIANSSNDQHLGLFQIDVFFAAGGGEITPRRIASSIISYFGRGTRIVEEGFNIDVPATPRMGPMSKGDTWSFIPVRVPYNCFAIPVLTG